MSAESVFFVGHLTLKKATRGRRRLAQFLRVEDHASDHFAFGLQKRQVPLRQKIIALHVLEHQEEAVFFLVVFD